MKRPEYTGIGTDGREYALTPGFAIHETIKLFRQVLIWRGIKPHDEKACERCGFRAKNRELFVVHHRHYRTFQNEQPEDVCLLCKPCHAQLHDRTDRFALAAEDIPFVDPRWEEMIRTGYKPQVKK